MRSVSGTGLGKICNGWISEESSEKIKDPTECGVSKVRQLLRSFEIGKCEGELLYTPD